MSSKLPKAKLCCVLEPYVRCIGCDIPSCHTCWDLILEGKISLDECPTKYNRAWTHVSGHHAFGGLEYLERHREEESNPAIRPMLPLE